MQIIELDASKWNSTLDFVEALLAALGAPAEHGRNINALIDSMIYGGINSVNPPYTIRIIGMGSLSKSVADEIEAILHDLEEARAQAWTPDGRDVDVRFETCL